MLYIGRGLPLTLCTSVLESRRERMCLRWRKKNAVRKTNADGRRRKRRTIDVIKFNNFAFQIYHYRGRYLKVPLPDAWCLVPRSSILICPSLTRMDPRLFTMQSPCLSYLVHINVPVTFVSLSCHDINYHSLYCRRRTSMYFFCRTMLSP